MLSPLARTRARRKITYAKRRRRFGAGELEPRLIETAAPTARAELAILGPAEGVRATGEPNEQRHAPAIHDLGGNDCCRFVQSRGRAADRRDVGTRPLAGVASHDSGEGSDG